MRLWAPVLLVFLTSAAAGAATSLNPYIANSGFEASNTFAFSCTAPACVPDQYWNNFAPGWNVSGSAGDYRPHVGTAFGAPAFIDPFGGRNVGYTNSDSYLFQQLAISLVPGDDYSVTYEVGRRLDAVPGDYRMVVTAGPGAFIEGVNMWTLNGTTGAQAPGSWVSRTLNFTATAAAGGAPVTLWLATDSGGQVNWDLPEPSTLSLIAVGLALCASRRRLRA